MSENNQSILESIIVSGEKNRIEEVVVFSNQAYIKRLVEINSEIGLNRFLIEITAFYVDKDSIQAAVFGHGQILTVQYRQVPVVEAVQTEVHELDDKKRHLEQRKKTLLRERQGLDKQKNFLDSTIAFADVEIPKELKTDFPSPQDLQNMLSFLSENYKQFNDKETELEKLLDDLEDDLTTIQRKIKRLKKPQQTDKQYIEILFEAEKNENIKIEAFYVVSQANWKPTYKVDVSSNLSLINLTTFAQIEQSSGEDWDNISLSVSNAIPLKGSRLPEINSWRLHLSSTQIQPLAMPMAAQAGSVDVMMGASDGAVLEDFDVLEEPIPEAEFSQAEKQELPLAFEFKLPQLVSINSGSGDTIFPTNIESLKGEFSYLCIPKQDPLVYLVCKAEMEKSFIAGKLNIYFAGRFVASSFLTEKQAGQELLINLGAEREVKVSRERVTDKLTGSFFGVVDRLSAVRQFVYKINVENLKNKEIQLHLYDAAPISSIDRIQVKELKFNPEPDLKDWQDKEGVMFWDLKMEPNSNKNLQISFYVKYPKEDPPYEI